MTKPSESELAFAANLFILLLNPVLAPTPPPARLDLALQNLIAAVDRIDPLSVSGRVAGVNGLLIEAKGGLTRLEVGARCEIIRRADGPLPVEVVGVLRKPEKSSVFSPINDPKGGHWYTRDLAAMAKALGAERPAPYSLVAETSSNPELLALVPIPLPKDIPNRHLEYALTWFALALIDLIFYGALVRRHFQKP